MAISGLVLVGNDPNVCIGKGGEDLSVFFAPLSSAHETARRDETALTYRLNVFFPFNYVDRIASVQCGDHFR